MEAITLKKEYHLWKKRFDEEQSLLLLALDQHALMIHHVGSTAVPDLLAKPIVDIAVEAAFPPSAAVIDALRTVGYEHHGESGVAGRHWFTKGSPRLFNLHFCAVGSDVIRHQLLLRDQLVLHAHLRREYEAIKQSNLHGRDIDSPDYALAKSDFIGRVIADASL